MEKLLSPLKRSLTLTHILMSLSTPRFSIPRGLSWTRLLTPLLLFSGVLFVSCGDEKPIIPEERLRVLIQTGARKQAITEIRELLGDFNRLNSRKLSSTIDTSRVLRRSLRGNLVAWLEYKKLLFLKGEDISQLLLDVPGENLNLSNRGNFAVLLPANKLAGKKQKKNAGCLVQAISLESEGALYGEPLPADCRHLPAISDDGVFIYYIRGGVLRYRNLKNPGPENTLPAAAFTPRYKKVSNFFYLYDLPGQNLCIFFGSAGYYQLYLFSPRTGKLKSLGKGFSSPTLQAAGDSLIVDPAADKNPPEETKKSNLLAHIYSGGAGSLQLHDLLWENNEIKLAPGRKVTFFNSLTYLRSRGEFLVLKDNIFHYWNEKTNKLTPLPLVANHFVVLSQVLFFEDERNFLYFRRHPLSQEEKLLLQLLEQAGTSSN